ncbi:MAG: hypothetical protein H7224_05690 [Polaromonas sp.]|nr:hypothetical protein [Polaromonas sp.]
MNFINWFFPFLARALALVVVGFGAASTVAAVQAPPLPVGSSQVQIVPGQSPDEQGRMSRAHKHHSPGHFKKDMTRDDTLDGTSSSRRYGSDEPMPAAGTKNTPR